MFEIYQEYTSLVEQQKMNKELCSNFSFLTFDFIEPHFQPLHVAVATYNSRLQFESPFMLDFTFAIMVL